ncbi:hypothetical protein [Pseudomonas putida]|uniref:Uncharacterized protein n=1 Tax=Pseudomonas putida TaxID=303 RepID=A0A8I1JIN6_PSEPU|nr:hypothetical protein [Pseudomonas putida]MBI6883163.1 hypothetical protein [Pseudomonas putida]
MSEPELQISPESTSPADIYAWMSDQARAVTVTHNDTYDRVTCSWNISSGQRMKATGDSFAEATQRAFVLDTNPCNLRRAAYEPTVTVSAYSTGNRNGLYGWSGEFVFEARISKDIEIFELPALPKGWTWGGYAHIRQKSKRSPAYGVLKHYEIDDLFATKSSFSFEVLTSHTQWSEGDSGEILDVLERALGEFERSVHAFEE